MPSRTLMLTALPLVLGAVALCWVLWPYPKDIATAVITFIFEPNLLNPHRLCCP